MISFSKLYYHFRSWLCQHLDTHWILKNEIKNYKYNYRVLFFKNLDSHWICTNDTTTIRIVARQIHDKTMNMMSHLLRGCIGFQYDRLLPMEDKVKGIFQCGSAIFYVTIKCIRLILLPEVSNIQLPVIFSLRFIYHTVM